MVCARGVGTGTCRSPLRQGTRGCIFPGDTGAQRDAPVKPKRRGVPKGQKAVRWEPTDFQRGQVSALAVIGRPHDEIARIVGADPKTLRKHCREQLDDAHPAFVARLFNCLAEQAFGAPAQYDENGLLLREERPPNVTALIFALKITGKRYGLTERVEVGGEDGQPVRFIIEGFAPPALPPPEGS